MGDPAPQPANESMSSILNAYIQAMPELTRVTGENILPLEQRILAAQQAINPAATQSELDLYKQFGPQFANVSNDITAQQISNENKLLSGAGGDLVRGAQALQQEIDPEYYKTRAVAAQKSQDLLNAYDPNKLAGGTAAEVERNLNRMNAASGNTTNSGTTAAVNALGFGQALEGQRSALSNALANISQSLPAFKTNTDVLQQATGRSSTAGGQGLMSNIQANQAPGAMTANLGQNAFQSGTQLQMQNQQLNAQRESGTDKALKYGSQMVGSICCFIFLEAYNGRLPWYIRRCRDAFMPENDNARKGYVWMAQWLVPLMSRYSYIRELVDYLMIKPISRTGAYLCGEPVEFDYYAHRTYCIWKRVWSFIGRRIG